jgi:hypothetical protein
VVAPWRSAAMMDGGIVNEIRLLVQLGERVFCGCNGLDFGNGADHSSGNGIDCG